MRAALFTQPAIDTLFAGSDEAALSEPGIETDLVARRALSRASCTEAWASSGEGGHDQLSVDPVPSGAEPVGCGASGLFVGPPPGVKELILQML